MQINVAGNLDGIDISQFQNNPTINFVNVSAFAKFMWHRISSQSTGIFNPDDEFFNNIPQARAQGIPVGGYHFAGINTGSFAEAELQADNFIAQLKLAGFDTSERGQYGDLFPVLDFEDASKINGALTTDQLLEWVEHFIEYFQEQTGRKMLLYTTEFFAATENDFEHSTRGHILAKYPLWVAFYLDLNPEDRPNDFGGWTEWRAWQYSATGTVTGINGDVDLNYGPFTVSELAPPRDVQGFAAMPDNLSMNLHWMVEDDEVDIVGWNIYLNGSKIAFVTNQGAENSYRVLGLQNGQPYTFGIEAMDLDGDLSFNIVEVVATPEEQLLRVVWESPNGQIITFGGERQDCHNDFGYILQDFRGESNTLANEQTQKAPFQVGVSLFNVDVSPRILTLNGKIIGRNRNHLFQLRSDLIRAFSFEPDRDFEPLELFNAGTVRYFLPTLFGERELFIKGIPRDSPQLNMVEGTNNMVDFDIEFFCPGGFWIDSESFTERLPNAEGGGFEFPIEFPIEFPLLLNQITINNPGLVSAPVVMTIQGEMLNPTIRNLTTGKSITLLTSISASEQIKIFTEFGQKRIIRISGGVETNAINTLALTDADFWSLAPGNNLVEFVADANEPGSFIQIQYNPRYAGV